MEEEDLRLAVYRAFADDGRAPGVAQLAARLRTPVAGVVAGLRALAARRHLVIDDDGGDGPASVSVVLAHPFAAVPLGFSVMGPRTLWWGGCAWDSFAVPHLVPGASPVLVATTCPACDRPHAFRVGTGHPPDGTQVAHFLVPAARMWDDVVFTCAHQRIFCAPRCVDDWLAATGSPRGYVMDLATLWRLASHWYDGRLERGYVRREPAASARYLRDAGLSGPFWGG